MFFLSKVIRSYQVIFGLFIVTKLEVAYLQITDTLMEPQVAFTGDTTSDFIVDSSNIDMLRAKILVMEVHCLPCFIEHQ